MRLKSFNQFITENEEVSKGEMLQFQLRDFNTKKNNLKNLIMSNINTDKDISKNYEDIVEENPFLQHYGTILKLQADIQRKENKLKESEETINKLNGDLKLVDKLSDQEDKNSQTKNINQQIEDKKESIKEDQESIKEMEGRIKEMEEDLKKMVKDKEEELKEIESNSVFENLYIDHEGVQKDIEEEGHSLDGINRIKSLCEEANDLWGYLERQERKEIIKKFNINSKIPTDLSSLPYNKIETVCNYVIKTYSSHDH